MYAGLATLIATELNKMGFKAREFGAGVIVSLNRPVNTMEVMDALDQAFSKWGHNFKVSQVGNKVMVKE